MLEVSHHPNKLIIAIKRLLCFEASLVYKS